MPQKLTILGSTGSIGVNTLDVVARHPDLYQVFALTANQQIDVLLEQCVRFKPVFAVVLDEYKAACLRQKLQHAGLTTSVLVGVPALMQVASAPEVDTVMAAIVGAAGLAPAMAAAEAGKRILLANKEALVVAGSLFMQAVKNNHATLLPIDSEHNAVFQSLPANYAGDAVSCGVRAIHLTASGGPFLNRAIDTLKDVTPEEACKHPNWVMGRKISVDSASMMNKGLEVIEAHWLFHLAPELIQVVIHPQSVIHSLVEYVDGSFVAQLGSPDMRTPIAHALAYPKRIESGVKPLSFSELGQLTFTKPDCSRFPCLSLAYDALRNPGCAPAILNAANEIAVAAFLERRLRFTDIPVVIEQTLSHLPSRTLEDIAALMDLDAEARHYAAQMVTSRGLNS